MEPPDPGKLWPPRHCARYRGAPYPDLSRTPVPSTEKASASDQKIQAGEQHFGTAEIQHSLCDVCYTDDYAVLSVYQVGVGSY